jgi:hypothetical protein
MGADHMKNLLYGSSATSTQQRRQQQQQQQKIKKGTWPTSPKRPKATTTAIKWQRDSDADRHDNHRLFFE